MKSIKKFGKWLLVIVGVPFAILAAVLLVRTAQVTSRQVNVPTATRVSLDADLMAGHLADAIRFPTIAQSDATQLDADAFQGLHDWLAETYPLVHATLERETVQDFSLLYHWPGTNPKLSPILLMSHLDVVPVESATEHKWTHPPFAGEVADGYVWGRGALDVKCGVTAILEAVEHLLKADFQPERTVYLAFGHDEEVGGVNGNARMAILLRGRGVRFQYVLDEGGLIAVGLMPGLTKPVAMVSLAEKGYTNIELTCETAGGHSSMPPPQTAVGILASAVARVEAQPLPAHIDGATGMMLDYLGPEFPFPQKLAIANRWLTAPVLERMLAAGTSTNALIRTTTAATVFHGGVGENVLPTRARAVINFRILPGETSRDVLEHVRRVVDDVRVECRQRGSHSEPSRVTAVDSPEFAQLQRTIGETFPDVLVSPGLTVGATDSRHYESLTEHTFRFLPMRLEKDDLPRIHGIDERISVENYCEMIRFFIQQIRNSTL